MARKRGAGEGSIGQRKSDGLFFAAITVGGKRRVKYAKTRTEATKKLMQLQAEAAGGSPQSRKDITIEDLMREFLESKAQGWSANTNTSAEQSVRLQILPTLGPVRLSEFDGRKAAAWVRSLPMTRTGQKARLYLSSACDMAVRYEWLARNPVAITEPIKATKKPPPELSPDHLRQVLAALEGHPYYACVCLMLGCGLRISEALGLTWGDWNEAEGLIRIEKQLYVSTGPVFSLVPLKTKASYGLLQVPAFTARALTLQREAQEAQKAETIASGKKWGNEWGLITTGRHGAPVGYTAVAGQMGRALEKAGVAKIHPHALRHAFASLLLDSGLPITEVARAMRHASPAVTMSVYAHKIEGKPLRTAGIMDGFMEG